MLKKHDVITYVMETLCLKIEMYFKEQYYFIFSSNEAYIYYTNFKIPHPALTGKLIERQSCGNMQIDLEKVNMSALLKLDEEFKIYIDMRDQVEDALINLSNRISTSMLDKLMKNFINRDVILEGYIGHPFWALYKKQKLINKMWGT